MPLMAVSGRPTVTIRRHDFDIHRVSQLVELGVCDDLTASFCPLRCGLGPTSSWPAAPALEDHDACGA